MIKVRSPKVGLSSEVGNYPQKKSGSYLPLLKESFKTYCDQTSLHGYSYLFRDEERDFHFIHQIVWTLVILASICLSLYFMAINWDQFHEAKTVTTINSTTASLIDLYFPSVFICNINQVTLSFLNRLELSENNPQDQKMIELLFRRYIRADGRVWENTTLREALINQEELDKKNKSSFTLEARLKRIGWNETFSVLKLSAHKNTDTLLSSSWKSTEELFFMNAFTSLTDYGACAVIYPQLDFDFTPQNASSRQYDGMVIYNKIVKGVKNGVGNGLKFLIDAESFDYGYHHRSSKGFMVALADQRDKAIVYQNGFYVATGTENLVAISAEKTQIGPDKSRFDPVDRDCFTDDEFKFMVLRQSEGFRCSLTNCLYEAVAERVLDNCRCKPNFITFPLFPNNTNSSGVSELTPCVGSKLACMQYYMDNLGNEELRMKSSYDENGNLLPCLQRCTFQTEKVVVTSSRYPNVNTFIKRADLCITIAKIQRICENPAKRNRFLAHYAASIPFGDICATTDYYYSFMGICTKNEYKLNENVKIERNYLKLLMQYATENLVVLRVFFKEPYYTSFSKKDKISYSSFIADVGGLMGLCMGLSFVSVAEWVYHLAKLFYKMYHA